MVPLQGAAHEGVHVTKSIVIPVTDELVFDFREKLLTIEKDIHALMEHQGITHEQLAENTLNPEVIDDHNELILTSIASKIAPGMSDARRILTALTLASSYAHALEIAITEGRFEAGFVYLIAAQSALLSAAGCKIGVSLGKLEVAHAAARSESGKKAADARHSLPGGAKEKRDSIRQKWEAGLKEGRWRTKDEAAEAMSREGDGPFRTLRGYLVDKRGKS